MYDYIEKVTKTTKLPPQAVRDNNDNDLDEEVYNEEVLRLQRSGLHLIAARPVVLQATDVLQWIATHVDFKRMAVVSDEGVDGGKNPSQQRGSLPVPQVPIRLTNVWYGRPDEIMDALKS